MLDVLPLSILPASLKLSLNWVTDGSYPLFLISNVDNNYCISFTSSNINSFFLNQLHCYTKILDEAGGPLSQFIYFRL